MMGGAARDVSVDPQLTEAATPPPGTINSVKDRRETTIKGTTKERMRQGVRSKNRSDDPPTATFCGQSPCLLAGGGRTLGTGVPINPLGRTPPV